MFLEAVGHIGWWSTFLYGEAERPRIYNSFTFKKQCPLSQYAILGPNKRIVLSIPTAKESRKGAMGDVRIGYAEPWQQQHWNSLLAAYRSAAFFPYYAHLFEALYQQRTDRLLDFQVGMFKALCRALRVSDQLEWDPLPMRYTECEWKPAQAYPQVFDDRHGFVGDVCLLDMLFNLGPETLDRLKDHSSIVS